MEKICSCFGINNIEITKKLKTKLYNIYLKLIEDGFNTFYFGGCGEFESLCCSILRDIKTTQPNIRLVYVRPYYNKFSNCSILYNENFDEEIYIKPKKAFLRYSIIFRNYAMIDKSNCVLIYVDDLQKNGIGIIYKYAKTHFKKIINCGKYKKTDTN